MAQHRFLTRVRLLLSRDPRRVGVKENNRCLGCVRHDRQLLPKRSDSAEMWDWCGYWFVIPECPANPETEPPLKMRISREFARSPEPSPGAAGFWGAGREMNHSDGH
jgi:hypothetical protein